MCHLKKGAMNVTQLEKTLGIKQADVSQQLRVLRMNNLVGYTRKNGYSYYSISPEKLGHVKTVMNELFKCLGQ